MMSRVKDIVLVSLDPEEIVLKTVDGDLYEMDIEDTPEGPKMSLSKYERAVNVVSGLEPVEILSKRWWQWEYK
jgi:hypothetical protein